MKKTMIIAAMMTTAISASAAAKNSWPTNVGKYPTTSWSVAKYPATPKFPKLPSWPSEPVTSGSIC